MNGRNRLVTLYIRSCAIGFLAAAGFVGLLMWFNVAGIGHLVTASSDGLLALGLLFMFNGIVFSGVQFGIAVMSMAEPGDTPRGGKRETVPARLPVRVPVRVPAEEPAPLRTEQRNRR